MTDRISVWMNSKYFVDHYMHTLPSRVLPRQDGDPIDRHRFAVIDDAIIPYGEFAHPPHGDDL